MGKVTSMDRLAHTVENQLSRDLSAISAHKTTDSKNTQCIYTIQFHSLLHR